MFAALQSAFATALFDPAYQLPDDIISHTMRCPDKRFAVYRNNVVAGLINALREKFPAIQRIVGEEFFAAMARVFITTHPPRSKILHTYGDDLGDFIATFQPAVGLPYLADVARLEDARTRAYHAADAMPLDASSFTEIDPCDIGAMRIALHPSLSLLRSRHPVVTIWSMNAGETPLGPINETQAEDALIVRPGLNVNVRTLPPGGAAFLATLGYGATLAEAAVRAEAADARFDLTANIAGLIGSGAATQYYLTEDRTP